MPYNRNGIEYLTADELQVHHAVHGLNCERRTTNNTQIAVCTGFSRSRVAQLTESLRAHGWIKDVSEGAARHWRLTGKQLPNPAVPNRTPGPEALARMFPMGGSR